MHHHVLRLDSRESFLKECIFSGNHFEIRKNRVAPLILLRQLTNEYNHLHSEIDYLAVVLSLPFV